jgi:predicted nuclease of predicted toxin-antitoxin system
VILLFDENLSFRLPLALADIYPGAIHVRDLGLMGAADKELWVHGAATGCTIVTKDSDFYQRGLLYGHPPKVVWIHGIGAMKIAARNDFGVVAMPFLIYHLVELGYMSKEPQMGYGEQQDATARFCITD